CRSRCRWYSRPCCTALSAELSGLSHHSCSREGTSANSWYGSSFVCFSCLFQYVLKQRSDTSPNGKQPEKPIPSPVELEMPVVFTCLYECCSLVIALFSVVIVPWITIYTLIPHGSVTQERSTQWNPRK